MDREEFYKRYKIPIKPAPINYSVVDYFDLKPIYTGSLEKCVHVRRNKPSTYIKSNYVQTN